jgi:hypothetical protein
MAKKARGKVIPLSVGRRLVAELLHHARQVPSLPLARACRLPELAAARRQATPAPSWMAIFMRAYGLVAGEVPELRRAWVRYPWPRLYEHPSSDCALLVEREHGGETVVLATKVRGPENQSLAAIDAHLRHFRETPLEQISSFRQLLRLGRAPWWFLRFTLWSSLSFSGFTRATRFGTFMMSSLGNLGVEQIHPLTPLTTYFTFGPVGADGGVTLKIVYDHRVMDGRCVARALVRLEEVLGTVLLDEVRGMAPAAAA